MLEKAQSIGGTWRDNHYPGAACDIPSSLYSFSFAPNPHWTRIFPPQREIQDYLERTVDAFGVRQHMRFGKKITRAAWDDAAKFWRIDTDDGDTLTARAFVSGMGGLHTPNMPDLPGLAEFKGEHWHTSRWRDDVSLDGKRIALIGTGASAIQIVPVIAPIVGQLDLYQRTPSWIVPKGDREMSAAQKARLHKSPTLQEAQRRLTYAIFESRAPAFLWPMQGDGIGASFAKRHIARQIKDPALRAKVTPSFKFGCKRVIVSDDYYPALERDNVALIAKQAVRVTADSVIDSDGIARPADVIVFATGFKPMDLISSVDVVGVGGRKLSEEWAAGPQAYLGTFVSGYPNFFTLMGPNSALGHNSMIYMIESQIAFVMDALKRLDSEAAAALDVKAEVQRAFNDKLQARLEKTVWGAGCTSWYLAPDGKNRTLWPGFTFSFRAKTKRVKMEDFELLR